MNNSETEVDHSSSSSDHSCPVALVPDLNLPINTLCLPQDLCPAKSINDGIQGDNNKKEECMDLERKNKRRGCPPTSPSQTQFMTLNLLQNSLLKGRQYLSSTLMRKNGVTKPGKITLIGKDDIKWQLNLRAESKGRMCLGKGWKEFAKANGLKTGDNFTLEFVWENEIPMLSLVNIQSTNDTMQIGESSKSMEKEFSSTDPCNIDEKNSNTSSLVQNRIVTTLALVPKDTRQIGESSKSMEKEFSSTDPCNIDEKNSNTASLVQNRIVTTLALVPKDVKAGSLYLPSEFMTAIGIKKLGKITLLGKDKMKWWGYLLSQDGTVDVGCGWGNFCEGNGVKIGESFSLEFINEEEDTSPVFKFRPNSGD